MNSYYFYLIILSIGFTFSSCSTELDINAEAEDIWVVWSILNPSDSVQYVRISKGFLPEEDAFVYAKENDLSAKGLTLSLTDGINTYIGVETDSILKNPADGTFFPYLSLYRFDTKGTLALKPNQAYTLNVSKPDDGDFFLRARTHIPDKVTFNNPRIVRGPNGHCLLPLALDIGYEMKFQRAEAAAAYELRAFLNYTDKGQPRQATFGPSALFEKNVRCLGGGGLNCYQFRPKELIEIFRAQMDPQANRFFEYTASENLRCAVTISELPDAFRFEVTTVDSVLYNYAQANSPKFTDFNTLRIEYTNIESSARALGILGAIAVSDISASFDPCTEYLLGLNSEQPRPSCTL